MLAVLSLLISLLFVCKASAQGVTVERLNQAEREPQNWLTYGGTYRAWRYSPLNQINSSNVHKLVVQWAFQLGSGAWTWPGFDEVEGGLQATPLVADGILYVVGTGNRVFALDAATGKKLWSYFYKYPRGQTFGYGHASRGLAIGHGHIYMGTLDNFVVALDSATGEEVWKVNVENARKYGCNITGAPLVVRNMVVVGSTGGDSAHRGHIVAFDARTGKLRWRFNTIPGPGEKGNETWRADSWKYGGGAAWMTGSYDPALNLLYWGIGNPAADWYGEARQGSNLYTDSVVALKANSGELAWYFQEIPHDVWDFDSAYECILVDLPVRGTMRKLLLHPNKGGFVYVLDRTNGEYITAWRYADSINWTTGLDAKGVPQGRKEPVVGAPTLICPFAGGARSWNQAAFHPQTGLLYNIGIEWCSLVEARKEEPREGQVYLGGSYREIKPPPASREITAHLDAHDPLSGKKKWSYPSKYPLMASLLSTGGNLVFTGDPEGNFFALDARTGKKLWSFATGSGHRGSAITYSVKGKQYIATPSGWGSFIGNMMGQVWPEVRQFTSGATIFVFALREEQK